MICTDFLIIIFLCCTVTLGCLVLQQRYQRRHITMSYEHLRNNTENNTTENTITENTTTENTTTERSIVDVEDLVSPLINAPM